MRTLLASFALLAAAAGHCQDALTLSAGADYSTGTYGTSERTDIWYFPLVAKYERGLFTGKVTVPYLRITGPGNVIGADGIVIQPIPPGTTVPRTTQSGLGDIVAAASYTVFYDRGSGTLVDLTGKIKFPTADAAKGLGTGETDYAAQVDAHKSWDRWAAFATVGYRVMGEPPDIELRNVWFGSIGGTCKFTPGTTGGLSYDYRQSTSASGAPMREVTAFVSHRLHEAWKAQLYLLKGFSDGSSDWGVGALVSFAF